MSLKMSLKALVVSFTNLGGYFLLIFAHKAQLQELTTNALHNLELDEYKFMYQA